MRSKAASQHEPVCMLAHNMINKFSDIIGYCDLLLEKAEPGTVLERRLGLIREIADGAAKELHEHQVQEEAMRRIASPRAG